MAGCLTASILCFVLCYGMLRGVCLQHIKHIPHRTDDMTISTSTGRVRVSVPHCELCLTRAVSRQGALLPAPEDPARFCALTAAKILAQHSFETEFYCTVLYCTVLRSTHLYYTVLYSAALLHCTALRWYSLVLPCTVLHCTGAV